jgi:hypothetical protein
MNLKNVWLWALTKEETMAEEYDVDKIVGDVEKAVLAGKCRPATEKEAYNGPALMVPRKEPLFAFTVPLNTPSVAFILVLYSLSLSSFLLAGLIP